MKKNKIKDVKKVVRKWHEVSQYMKSPGKEYLRSARLAIGENNLLLIIFHDALAKEYFFDTNNMSTLKMSILADTGCDVEIGIIEERTPFETQARCIFSRKEKKDKSKVFTDAEIRHVKNVLDKEIIGDRMLTSDEMKAKCKFEAFLNFYFVKLAESAEIKDDKIK